MIKVGDFVTVEVMEHEFFGLVLSAGEFAALTVDDDGNFTGGMEFFEQDTPMNDPRIVAGKNWVCFDGHDVWNINGRTQT